MATSKAPTKRKMADTPWDRSCREVVVRGGCELERGVNYFVTSLERLGARTTFSCEGHPKGFYVVFEGNYEIAVAVRRAGFFSVELEGNSGAFSLRLTRNEVGAGNWDEKAKQECLRWASEAWERALFGDSSKVIRPELTVELFSRGLEVIRAIQRMWVGHSLATPGPNHQSHDNIGQIMAEFDLNLVEWGYWVDIASGASPVVQGGVKPCSEPSSCRNFR